jgi:catechol 2,3-dioxygenase-like lactoylglutathione lyase family enzyme
MSQFYSYFRKNERRVVRVRDWRGLVLIYSKKVERLAMAEKFSSVFRIFIPVSDLEKAVSFYQRLFDVEGRSIRGGRHYFDCGPVILAIVENSGPLIADHVYFAVPNLETVFTRVKELDCLESTDVHGSPAGEIVVRPWGERSFYVRDPFGNGLCFVDEQTLFTGL